MIDRNSEEQLELVVKEHTPLVERIVTTLLNDLRLRVERQDLLSYGFMGLIEAWKRFDPELKISFSTFAYYRIRGAILDGCRREGWVPKNRVKQARMLRSLNDSLSSNVEAQQDVPPARTFTDALSRVEAMIHSSVTIVLVEQAELGELIDTESPTPHELAEESDLRSTLMKAMASLSDQEREVVKRYYVHDESLSEIARNKGASVSWISRIHSRAIDKTRDSLLRSGFKPSKPGR